MANSNVACAVRLALIAASAASAGAYTPGALAQDAEVEQIIVTGSRIARPQVDTASPIAVLGSQDIALSGTQNIENLLNTMPQVVANVTSASNNPGGGVATVNLRNLGSQRTLVLVDGRRYVSYDVNQVVDLNTIPAALVERVDVVTGGRSAVYGSDAISGVVNFVMKRDFEGAEINSSYGVTDQGDGTTYGGDLTVGGNFADGRGNAVVHASYYSRDGVYADARKFTKFSYSESGGVAFPGGSSSIPELRFNVTGLGTRRFDENGNIVPYDPATDLYNFGPSNYIQVPQERYLIYGKAHFEVNDWFKPYAEAQFINNKVPQQLAPTPIGNNTPGVTARGGLQIHVYSPFLSSSAQTTLQGLDTDGDGYVSSGAWGRRMSEMGPRIASDDRNAFRMVFGTKGDITADWNYDAFYMYAQTQNSQTQDGNVAISRFMSATRTAFMNDDGDVQVLPWSVGNPGTLVCADAGARDSGCVPLNIYGPNRAGGDAVDFISVGTINREQVSTEMASASVSNGNLWDPWGAGPIGVAFGAEYRRESGENQTDEYLASGDVAGFNPSSPTKGNYAVTEYFAEVNVPILHDVTFAKTLDFNGAYRKSDYSNDAVGSVDTWAVGMQWAPIQSLMFRGQYQRAIRAPSVAELYLGQTVSFDGAIDPCIQPEAAAPGALRDLCIATGVPAGVVGTDYGSGGTSYAAIQGGNPDLQEETADTWTAGVVIQPSAIDNLVITLDYYSIKIEDAITTGVGTQNLVDACFDFNVSALCNQITRASTGEFELFSDTNVNAATLETSGVDLDVSYNFDLGVGLPGAEGSSLAFRLNGTWLEKNDYTPIEGLPLINECAGAFGRNCGAPDPEWRHSLRTTWSSGPFDISLLWRYLDGVTDDDPGTDYAVEEIDAVSYFDLSGSWSFNDVVTLAAGIENLGDKFPDDFIASGQQGGNGQQSNTYPTVYDIMGRTYWATLKVKF